MNEEEEKAVEQLNKFAYLRREWFSERQATIILNLIIKLLKENVEKDKQIDLMAEKIHFLGSEYDDFCIDTVWNEDCDKDCKNCIKQYFERKVRE